MTVLPGGILNRLLTKLENKSPTIATAEMIAPVVTSKPTNGANIVVVNNAKTMPRIVFDFPNSG